MTDELRLGWSLPRLYRLSPAYFYEGFLSGSLHMPGLEKDEVSRLKLSARLIGKFVEGIDNDSAMMPPFAACQTGDNSVQRPGSKKRPPSFHIPPVEGTKGAINRQAGDLGAKFKVPIEHFLRD